MVFLRFFSKTNVVNFRIFFNLQNVIIFLCNSKKQKSVFKTPSIYSLIKVFVNGTGWKKYTFPYCYIIWGKYPINIKILREGVEVREHKTSVTVATFYWRACIKPGKFVVMYIMWVGGLWCLTSLSTIFQLYRGG